MGEPSIDPKTLIAAFSASIAVFSAGVSIYTNWRTRKLSETSIRIAEFNAAQAHRKAIYDWASACQDALAETYALYAFSDLHDASRERTVTSVMIKLTSLIDKGRWLLPNKDHDKYGTSKQAAYTGFRQLPLDCLVSAYRALQSDLQAAQDKVVGSSEDSDLRQKLADRSKNTAHQLMLVKREFTSAIQEKLEPRVVEVELAKLKLKAKT